MKDLLMLVVAMVAMTWCAVSNATECYDDEGKLINLPDGYKVIMVPWWVDPEKLVAPVKPAKDLPDACEPKLGVGGTPVKDESCDE